jgi:hypothetical protein
MRARLALLLGCTAILAFLTIHHLAGLNGPAYWRWEWRDIPAWRLYPAMLFGLTPLFFAQVLEDKKRCSPWICLTLVGASSLALQLIAVGVQTEPPDLRANIVYNVSNPIVTSYFTDAAKISSVTDFLHAFPFRISSLNLHSQTKPPGTILYYLPFIKIWGYTSTAALVAGLATAVLSIVSVFAVYLFLRTTASSKAAFYGASYFAVCPGFIVFAPKLDQLHPILACALCGCWIKALDDKRLRYALGFALVLMITCFVSYSLLVLGIFLLLYSLLWLGEDPRADAPKLFGYTVAALAVFIAGYGVFWILTGFNAVATFRAAIANQTKLALIFDRPYPETIPFDLADFALGTGWISFLIVAFFIARQLTATRMANGALAFTVISLVQFVTVAATGLLAAETARVWLFMAPLLMIPVGAELAYWRLPGRMAAYACLSLLTAVITQNMTFIR